MSAYSILTNTYGWQITPVPTVLATPDLIVEYNQPTTRSYIETIPILSYSPAFLSVYTDVIFSIEPNLPPGLTFDSSTGTISGTPTEIREKIMYTVTTTANAGQIFVNNVLYLTVTNAFYYYPNSYIYIKDVQINSTTPIVAPGISISSYTISPSLPLGLFLNTTTGTISGKPLVQSAKITYTITATKTDDTAVYTTLSISIADLYYSISDYIFMSGVSIETIQPSVNFLYGNYGLNFESP